MTLRASSAARTGSTWPSQRQRFHRRSVLIAALAMMLSVTSNQTSSAEAEKEGFSPILHARCVSLDTAKGDAEVFCRKHQSASVAECTDSLADAVWQRCSSWLDSGNGGIVSLPVAFEADPEETCAMHVTVDDIDHCIFSQKIAAASLPNEIILQSMAWCRSLLLDDSQCSQLTRRMLNVSTRELLKRIAHEAERSSVGKADGTRPFITPTGDTFKMGALQNLKYKLSPDETDGQCLSISTVYKGKSHALPLRDSAVIDVQGMFPGGDVLQFSQFQIDIDTDTHKCTPKTTQHAMFCVSVARYSDITSSSTPLDLGCLSSSHHNRFLLGNLPFGPHLVNVLIYNTTVIEAHPAVVASASSRINVVAKLRHSNVLCPRCLVEHQHRLSPLPPPPPIDNSADDEGTLTLLVLVNRGRNALSNALSSWKRVGLLDYVSERVAFVQNFARGVPGDKRVALLRDYGFKVVGHPSQKGIAQGLSLGVQNSSSTSILFLEEDFACPPSITQSDIQRNIRRALGLIRTRVADVVRLRSTRFPGTPHCANIWRDHGRARDLLGHASTSWVNNISTLCAGSVVRTADERPAEGLWDCSDDGSAICAFSTHASWTNNPILFSREFFLRNIAPVAAIDSTKTLEAAVSFTPAAWGCRCHTVAQLLPGCFMHDDRDKPQWQQTVCPDVRA